MTDTIPSIHFIRESVQDVHGKIASLRNLYLTTEDQKAIERQLVGLITVSRDGDVVPRRHSAGRETRGLALIGPAGSGKTTLIEKALAPLTQKAPHEDESRRLVIRLTAHSSGSLKTFGADLVRATGYPDISSRANEDAIWNLATERFQLVSAKILWIDEAHDLFMNKSQRAVIDALKRVKSLMQGDHPVVVILSGIDALWQIASVDPQVSRRFSRMTLKGVSEIDDASSVDWLVGDYCKRVGLTPPPSGGDLAGRLIHASRGRFGRCVENTIAAIEEALLNGDKALDRRHFAEAWALQEGCDPAQNVFVAQKWRDIQLDAHAVSLMAAGEQR